nr:hypothetical protein [uncultured Mucilaginibacter sp.]
MSPNTKAKVRAAGANGAGFVPLAWVTQMEQGGTIFLITSCNTVVYYFVLEQSETTYKSGKLAVEHI